MIQNKPRMDTPLFSHLHKDSLHVSGETQSSRSRHSHLQSRLLHFLLSASLQWLPSSMHSQLQVSFLNFCFALHFCLQLQSQAVWLLREISACFKSLLISSTRIVTSSSFVTVHGSTKKGNKCISFCERSKGRAQFVSVTFICELVYSNFIGNHRVLCLSYAWTKNGLETQLIHGLISAACSKRCF